MSKLDLRQFDRRVRALCSDLKRSASAGERSGQVPEKQDARQMRSALLDCQDRLRQSLADWEHDRATLARAIDDSSQSSSKIQHGLTAAEREIRRVRELLRLISEALATDRQCAGGGETVQGSSAFAVCCGFLPEDMGLARITPETIGLLDQLRFGPHRGQGVMEYPTPNLGAGGPRKSASLREKLIVGRGLRVDEPSAWIDVQMPRFYRIGSTVSGHVSEQPLGDA